MKTENYQVIYLIITWTILSSVVIQAYRYALENIEKTDIKEKSEK